MNSWCSTWWWIKPGINNDKTDDSSEIMRQKSDLDISNSLKQCIAGFQAVVTWVILILFGLIPLLLFFFRTSFNFTSSDPAVYYLFFGGIHRDFLLGAHQWWRIFTYPVAGNSVFSIVLFGLLLYIVGKTAEMAVGSVKLGLFLGGTYPLCGLLLGLLPGVIIAGPQLVIAIMLGMILGSCFSTSDPLLVYLRRFSLRLIFFFALIFFFTKHYWNFLFVATGVLGGLVTGLSVNKAFFSNWKLRLTIGLVVGLVVFVSIVVMATWRRFLPGVDQHMMDTLQQYYQSKFFSQHDLTKLLANYYHLYHPSAYFEF